MKGVSHTIKNKAKEQKKGFFGMLLGTLGASLLGNLLTGKGAIATSQGRKSNMPGRGAIRAAEVTIRTAEGTIRAGQGF